MIAAEKGWDPAMMAYNRPRVAAVILNYNTGDDCRKCLHYLHSQEDADVWIVVVDNGSTLPGEAERLEALCQEYGAALILNRENGGFSAGNNLGLRAAAAHGADWMLVLNPDVELLDPHYIRSVMDRLENWPEAAVIGTNVLLPDGRRQNPMREPGCLAEIFWPVETIRRKLGLGYGHLAPDRTGYCEKVAGCCFFVSRECLEAIGCLDEHVFMYCEEPILAKQARKAGFRELYLREITAYHAHRSRTEGKAQAMLMLLRSRIYYIQRYSGYPPVLKQGALLSKRAELLFWKHRSRCPR